MNPTTNAVRVGLDRGWTEFKLSIRSPQDQGFYLFTTAVVLGYLFIRRNHEDSITDLPYATVALPGILGGLIAFGMVIGPAYALAMEREDGTLLRAKAAPNGIVGHFTGHVVSNSLGILPSFAVLLIPAMLLLPDVAMEGSGWLTVLWVTVLGVLVMLPIGLVIGSLVPGVQKVGTWGMLPFVVLTAISGVLFPLQSMWGWVQGVAQVFPLYWLGVGMRAAFLPESAGAAELAGSYRLGTAAIVLSLWAIGGIIVAPMVLARMARRQSGSQVEAARDQALQWVR
jgi:ABC-2 type transport system permease protein